MGYFKKMSIIGVVLVSTTINSFALKAEYRFEDSNGHPTTKNYQDLKLDGNLSGDANILNNGKIKNGLNLSGNGAMIVKHDPNLDLIESLTISFWIYPEEYKREALIVKGYGGGVERGANAEYSLVLWEDGKLKYKHNGKADTFSNTTIPLKKWTHIALVRDNTKNIIRIYINGKLDSNNTYTTPPVSSGKEKLLIGTGEDYSKTVGNFNGRLDEIKIYAIALTVDEIVKMYSNESTGNYYTGEFKVHNSPKAFDDTEEFENSVTIDVLSNDVVYDTPKCEFDKSTLKIVSRPEGGIIKDENKTLVVPNQGTWSVIDGGKIKFISNSDFYDNPTDISYTISDSCGGVSNHANISLTRVAKPTSTPTPVVDTPTPTPRPVVDTPTPRPTSEVDTSSTSTYTSEVDTSSTSTSTSEVDSSTTSAYTSGVNGSSTSTSTSGVDTSSTSTSTSGVDTSSASTSTSTPTPTPTPTEDNQKFYIGDRVWYDDNKNGIQDNNEDGVKNITVILYRGGEIVKRTKTDTNGTYRFNNISGGKYLIKFTNIPSGYIFTKQNAGANDKLDSDVNSSGKVNINVTKNNLTYDAGIITSKVNSGISNSGISNSSINNDCDCKDYKSTPSLNSFGTVILFLLITLLGTLFIKEEDLKLNTK